MAGNGQWAWVLHFKWNGPYIRTGKQQTFAYVFLQIFFVRNLHGAAKDRPSSTYRLFYTWMNATVVLLCVCTRRRQRHLTHRHNDRKLNNGKHPIRSEQMRFYVSANFSLAGLFSRTLSLFGSTSIRHHAIIALLPPLIFIWSARADRQTSCIDGLVVLYARLRLVNACTSLYIFIVVMIVIVVLEKLLAVWRWRNWARIILMLCTLTDSREQ